MTLLRAIRYFVREATLNLLRSWKISLLAISTIGVSVFIGGSFLLFLGNLWDLVEQWKRGAKVVVYLDAGEDLESTRDLTQLLEGPPWVVSVEGVTARRARERFQESFPSVADLVEGWSEEPLPASWEIAFDPLRVEEDRFEAWLDEIRSRPEVSIVDDDRDWVSELESALRVVTGVGITLGSILLLAAIFTIASVIRLTAYLHRAEIEVMRLVGATELFIRGPFYTEGLLQGLLGSLLSLVALWVSYATFAQAQGSFVGSALLGRFLGPVEQLLLIALGTASGLVGAIVSLRREAI